MQRAEALSTSRSPAAIDARYYTVKELAELLNMSENSIRNTFRDEPGVLKFNEKRGLRKRPHVTIRVPQLVLDRVIRRLAR